jgi:hypothetical protein
MWFRAGLIALLLMTWAGTAHGQPVEQMREMNENMESYVGLFRWFGTGLFILGIVGAVALVGMVAVRIYLHNSATTDPLKLAMSDPWVRAQLEKQQAAAAGGAPAEATTAPPAEAAPAGAAEVADDSDLPPITKA